MGAREVSWGYRESCVDAALTRASRRLQKKTATAAPLALSLDRERDQKAESELRKAPSGGVVSCHPPRESRDSLRLRCKNDTD